ncbi:cingulin isoform X1 [Ascaphus truei]|uniref:cingulin isoform X1 n=1 Tax=Ascaphus truei TaxID=8439 RepID=UPI003F5ACE06
MERGVHGEMADKHSPLDHGVQIRFIDDLREPNKSRKSRSKKQNSYGVAVRVQGIDGQPFVVLNSGDKSKSSYGVQIKTESSYGNPSLNSPPEYQNTTSKSSRTAVPINSGSDLPENPYATSSSAQSISQYSSTSDEEQSAKSHRKSRGGEGFSSKPRALQTTSREVLRRSQSQGSLLSPDSDELYDYGRHSELSTTIDTTYSKSTMDTARGRSSLKSLDNGEHPTIVSGFRSVASPQTHSVTSNASLQKNGLPTSTPKILPSEDIDTKPQASVDSLITKFDRKGQVRGRTARRSRILLDDKKRSQSLDGRVSSRETAESREAQASKISFREQSLAQTRGQSPNTHSTGSLSQSSNRGSVEAGDIDKNKLTKDWLAHSAEEPVIERRQQNTVQAELQLKSTPDLLKDQQPEGSDPTREMIYSILKDGTTDRENTLRKKTNLIFERIQSLRASSGEDSRAPVTQKKDLERKVAELQRQLDDETKQRMKLEASRERPRASLQVLEIQLEEKIEECNRLKELFEKKKQETNRMSQELMEVRMGKEQVETKMRSLEDQLLDSREELSELKTKGGSSTDKHAILKELMDTREEMDEMLELRHKHEEMLRQRERELTALKGVLKEEVANHDKEMDRVRQQYQGDVDKLRKNMDNVSQDQVSLESERQKINLVMRNLQRELEESSDEINQWKEMFQKNKDELRSTKQELLQVKMEKEEFEDELKELRDRFSLIQTEMDQFKKSSVNTGEADAVRKELQRVQDQLKQLTLDKRRQEDNLHQRERELSALKGALQEEASGHDLEAEKLRQQLQKETILAKKDYEELVKINRSLESEKAEAARMRQVMESTLQDARDNNDDLRRKILGLEAQVKELKTFSELLQAAESRLKDKLGKLEAERKKMEETLGEATDQEQELAMGKRTLESRLEEAQRSLSRLSLEYDELQECYQEEMKQKDQLKKTKNELEEQKRLLDKSIEKLNREFDHMSDESRGSLTILQTQLEEYKEKSRREIGEAQKQAKERSAEAEKLQVTVSRLQEEVPRLKQALQDSHAEKEGSVLDKDLLTKRLQSLEQDMESKKRFQDDRSRQVKVLEDKMKHLEVELDEERNTVELLTDRMNRSRDQMDQQRAELMQERSTRQDLECDKISLERQNKDLKSRLASSEGQQKPNANVPQLEARLQEIQDRLQVEEREKTGLLSSNRKLERKLKELSIQLEDERLQVNDQRDQLNLRVKALKRQLDEAEEEIERLEGLRKKAVREMEEQHEINDQLQSRIKSMEKESRRKNVRPTADEDLSSDGEFEGAYDPTSITSLLTESNLQTSSC